MYLAKVYKVMIGAPSDIQEEIQMAKNVIQKWNSINSEFRRRVLLPLHWSDNAYPETGIHPQKSINRMVVEKSDLLICIFCSRLGSPTDTHNSGSIEEIDEHIKADILERNAINDLDKDTFPSYIAKIAFLNLSDNVLFPMTTKGRKILYYSMFIEIFPNDVTVASKKEELISLRS